ncbi:hypothetical protein [Hymenobacter arizonensis]|uniref:Uncharacterized protein n=1 Tax=Hymenobacter arizonensis TaxID=1227077 RepID=A0A1I5Z0M9_HYMAR|nr:hypothetical protein [Hymenobacter arizonensis]SFQ50001.1 hypothetical protein SAMN04515668_2590 [Hymenobacter arizonensis]
MNYSLSVYLLFSGLLLANTSSGQSHPYRFDLKAEKLDVPTSPWQVTQVLDLRTDRSRLGEVLQGLDNHRVSADFTQSLATEVKQFVQVQMPRQPDARPVIMRVFTLGLSEVQRTSSEHAEAELVADFLEPQPDSSYRVLLSVGEFTRRGGLDVTKFHPANLALVLQQALRQLVALPAAPSNHETLSHADALAGLGGAAARRFPIQAAGAAPKMGVYRNLQEFLNNEPSEPAYPFTFEHIAHPGKRWAGTDEVQPNYLYTDNTHPTRPVSTSGLWGISDGKELLIAYHSRFYKLLPAADGRTYTFTGPPAFDAQAANTLAAAGAVAGLVGVAIASAANGARQMDLYELRLASGRVVPVQDDAQTNGFAKAPDSVRVYVYRRTDAAKNKTVTFSASGQNSMELQARNWTALTWRDRQHELKLCVRLGTGPEGCQEFVPDFSQPTYLECTVPADGGAPVLRAVSAKEGLFELRRIQRLRTVPY